MKKYLIITVIALIACCVYLFLMIVNLQRDRDKYQSNQDILLSDVEFYRVNDSLNVAQAGVLKMNIDEMKRYRADDAKLIKELKGKAKDLEQLTNIQASTISNFKGAVKDSIIIKDSIMVTLKCINVHNTWYDINGCINGDSIDGSMQNREKLKIIQRVRYKRFLGFLWKTNKIKDRRIDVISLNPNTHIENVESFMIEE